MMTLRNKSGVFIKRKMENGHRKMKNLRSFSTFHFPFYIRSVSLNSCGNDQGNSYDQSTDNDSKCRVLIFFDLFFYRERRNEYDDPKSDRKDHQPDRNKYHRR